MLTGAAALLGACGAGGEDRKVRLRAHDRKDRTQTVTDAGLLDGPRSDPADGGSPASIVVLLHGYGSNGDDLIGFVPYWREALPRTVESLTLQDVRNYYRHAFRPDLTTIVVIGKVTPEEAQAVIEKHFGGWTATG